MSADGIRFEFRLNDRFVCVNWDMEEFMAKRDKVVQQDLLRYQMRTG